MSEYTTIIAHYQYSDIEVSAITRTQQQQEELNNVLAANNLNAIHSYEVIAYVMGRDEEGNNIKSIETSSAFQGKKWRIVRASPTFNYDNMDATTWTYYNVRARPLSEGDIHPMVFNIGGSDFDPAAVYIVMLDAM